MNPEMCGKAKLPLYLRPKCLICNIIRKNIKQQKVYWTPGIYKIKNWIQYIMYIYIITHNTNLFLGIWWEGCTLFATSLIGSETTTYIHFKSFYSKEMGGAHFISLIPCEQSLYMPMW